MWALISLKTAASIVLLFLRELKQVEGDNKENLQRSSDDIQFILRSRSIARALGFQTITSPLTETDDSKRRSWKKSKESKKSKGKSAKKKSAKCGHRGSKSGKRSKSNSDEATGKEVPRKRKKGKGNCNGDTPPPAIHPTPALLPLLLVVGCFNLHVQRIERPSSGRRYTSSFTAQYGIIHVIKTTTSSPCLPD